MSFKVVQVGMVCMDDIRVKSEYVRRTKSCDGWMRVKDEYVWNAYEKGEGMKRESIWTLSLVEAT